MNKTANKNLELKSKRKSYVSNSIVTIFDDIFADRAKNSELWDCEGNRYLDFSGGIGSLNTGHLNATVMTSVEKQIQKLTHTAFQVIGYESYVLLAEKLCKLAPGKKDKKAVLFSTGAEALENAVKIARSYTKRPGVITFRGSFHGRTALTMAMTGKIVPYKISADSLPGNIYHIPLPVPHHGITEEASLNALEIVFSADIEPERVAAIVIEPVQGEGGFYFPSVKYMKRIAEICKEHGILFVSDEVQSGFGRTGKWFAIEHFDVEPDLITVAKSLAGGFPLSGVLGQSEIMDSPPTGGLGGTFGGNPVSCAAALGVIDEIEKKDLLSQSIKIGEKIKSFLEQQQNEKHGKCISHIRGLGGMCAFEFVDHNQNPDAIMAKKFVIKCKTSGLIILSCGIHGNTIRFLVPLTIPDIQLNEGFQIIADSLKATSI